MAATRKGTIHPRRRRDDAEEEEGSAAGDIEDDSLSEGSAASLDEHEREGSDASAGEDVVPPITQRMPKLRVQRKPRESSTRGPIRHAPAEQTTVSTLCRTYWISVAEKPKRHIPRTRKKKHSSAYRRARSTRPCTARRELQEYIQERNSKSALHPEQRWFLPA